MPIFQIIPVLNGLREKDIWVREIFMERYSKGEFHVLVNEMKPFDLEFFKHLDITLTTRQFDFLTVMSDSVCFVF